MQLSTDILPVNALLFLIGFAILIKGSDWFVESASFVARKLGIPDMVIGLTLVSIGTSLPELATNLYAACVGEASIALGNVVGSNISNICLVLAVGILILGVIPVQKNVLRRDATAMFAVFLLLYLFSWIGLGNLGSARAFEEGGGVSILDRILTPLEGIVFLVFAVGYICILLFRRGRDREDAKDEQGESKFKSLAAALVFLPLGLFCIVAGANMLVENVVWLAVRFNVPTSIVAATMIAFGTSVPELAVTLTGALKGKTDIAVGNIVGSCFFNITIVLGVTLMIRPVAVDEPMLLVVMPMMILAGALTMLFMWTSMRLVRGEAAVLLFIYVAFIAYSLKEAFT